MRKNKSKNLLKNESTYLSEKLISEFGIILKEEFNLDLKKEQLIQLAGCLVSYFQIFVKN